MEVVSAAPVHAGGDHRRRVDERGPRRRPFHRVGQPYVKRQLRRVDLMGLLELTLEAEALERLRGALRDRLEQGQLQAVVVLVVEPADTDEQAGAARGAGSQRKIANAESEQVAGSAPMSPTRPMSSAVEPGRAISTNPISASYASHSSVATAAPRSPSE